jgi:hypothetical protein
MSTHLLQQFLKARALIDADAKNEIVAPRGKKEERNVMEKPRPASEDTVRGIIESKPSKKAVMEFLKKKVAQYTDETTDEDM